MARGFKLSKELRRGELRCNEQIGTCVKKAFYKLKYLSIINYQLICGS